jgi:tetratricopeptide (TPR) repeat protein
MMRAMILVATIGLQSGTSTIGEIPTDVFIDWSFHNDAGWLAISRDRLDVAEKEFGAAIRKIQPYAQADPRLMARTYNDLAWVLYRQGRPQDAGPLADWALVVRERRLGRDSEAVAQTLYLLGLIESDLGHLDLAEARISRMLAIHEARTGADSDKTIESRLQLAPVQIERRKFAQAESTLNRVLKLDTKALDENSLYRALALAEFADLEKARGRVEESAKRLREAIVIYERANPPDLDSREKLLAQLRSLTTSKEKELDTKAP